MDSKLDIGNVEAGSFDIESGTFDNIKISVVNVKPSEMQSLMDTLTNWIKDPNKVTDTKIDTITKDIEQAEFPKEKKTREEFEEKVRQREITETKSLKDVMKDKILDYLGKHGAAEKSDVKVAVIDADYKSDEYQRFFNAWMDLERKGQIRLIDKHDRNSGWVLGE